MISDNMLKAAVEGLLIEPLVLPPLTPDGKAIVERVIRTLKDEARSRGTKGMHAKVVLGPKSKKDHKKARQAAVLSLNRLYRLLVDIVDERNHSPHRHLQRRADLRLAGVPPVPIAAYQWGLENVTGIQRPPLTDADYGRLLLTPDKATLVGGTLTYKGQRYFPDNTAAVRLSKRSPRKAHSVDVMVDRLHPVELLMPSSGAEWPRWKVDQKGMNWFRAITLEEQDAFSEDHALVIAQADHDALRATVAKPRMQASTKKRSGAVPSGQASPETIRRRSKSESDQMARALSGQALPTDSPARQVSDAVKAARDAEAAEQSATIANNRLRRRK